MNPESRQAVSRFIGAQEQFARDHAAPDWLARVRRRGIDRFNTLGFPNGSDEAWRFTSIRPILEREFVVTGAPLSRAGIDDLGRDLLADGPRIVLVDGVFDREFSRLRRLPTGVTVQSLAAVIRESPAIARPILEGSSAAPDDAFAALGEAFLNDGALIQVSRGVRVAEPIAVVHVSTTSANLAVFPRTLIVVEREGDVVVTESYVGRGSGISLTNAVTSATLGDGARLRHYRVQDEGKHAIHVASNHWTLARDAALESCSVALGASLARHQLVGVLNGPNASLILDGLSLLSGAQHGDHHTTIDHAQPHCESHEVFNGVFAGEARGVFNGRIIVRPGAQRTDSKQTSNSLLLSDQARADTQPQLEIYADDVKCTHGATLGPLDETALFYLLSRGLDRTEARNALTYGFAAEILARVSQGDIRANLDRLVRASLVGVIGRAA